MPEPYTARATSHSRSFACQTSTISTAPGNSSATTFQIHFAPSATTTLRFARTNPNSDAASHVRRANADGSESVSFDSALSIAAE